MGQKICDVLDDGTDNILFALEHIPQIGSTITFWFNGKLKEYFSEESLTHYRLLHGKKFEVLSVHTTVQQGEHGCGQLNVAYVEEVNSEDI